MTSCLLPSDNTAFTKLYLICSHSSTSFSLTKEPASFTPKITPETHRKISLWSPLSPGPGLLKYLWSPLGLSELDLSIRVKFEYAEKVTNSGVRNGCNLQDMLDIIAGLIKVIYFFSKTQNFKYSL